MLIHAYKRKEPTQVDTGNAQIEFKPNELGDVVADVGSQEDCNVLLGIREAFRIYGPAVATETKPKSVFVVTNGDETVDLSEMDDAALRTFALANEVSLHHKSTGDSIRKKIFEALTGK